MPDSAHEPDGERWRRSLKRRRRMLALTALAIGAVVWWNEADLSFRGAVPQRALPDKLDIHAELRRSIAAVSRAWIMTHDPRHLAFKWGEGVLLLGLQRASETIESPSERAIVEDYVSVFYATADAQAFPIVWSDQVTPAIAAAERALHGDEVSRRIAKRATRYVMNAPVTEHSGLIEHFGRSRWRVLSPPLPEAWVDSVFHVVPLLVRYAELTHDAKPLEEATAQTLGFLRALQDPKTGLLTHAFNDTEVGEPVPAFDTRQFWARGQGWMLAAAVEVLHALPTTNPARAELSERVLRLERVVRSRQAPSGLFHTLILRDDTYEESAGSALILYGMARGARYGIFGEATRRAVARGARGLLSITRERGDHLEVTGTSLGTNPVPAIYAWVPTTSQVSYGVGAWLLAAREIVGLD